MLFVEGFFALQQAQEVARVCRRGFIQRFGGFPDGFLVSRNLSTGSDQSKIVSSWSQLHTTKDDVEKSEDYKTE